MEAGQDRQRKDRRDRAEMKVERQGEKEHDSATLQGLSTGLSKARPTGVHLAFKGS